MSEVVKCIDVSHHQDFPDFEKVRAAGVIALVHKATEGSSYIDPNRAKNCSNALKAGIAISTYHWLSPGSNVSKQIQFYLNTLQPVEGERVFIDYEEDGCTLDGLHEAVRALLDDRRGLRIAVYSGHLLKEQLNGNHDALLADNTDLWLAQYTSGTPSWSKGTYPKWKLWQYSETGTINGISGSYVDLNRFDGSDEELVDWISPDSSVRPPKPPTPEHDFRVAGTVSHFGGPEDSGVSADEGLAFIKDIMDAPHLFLPYQPDGTTGLARRLNSVATHYVACRWDYDNPATTRTALLQGVALVRNTKTGQALTAFPADWGPNENTGRVADLSPGLMADLDLKTDDEVEVIYPYRG